MARGGNRSIGLIIAILLVAAAPFFGCSLILDPSDHARREDCEVSAAVAVWHTEPSDDGIAVVSGEAREIDSQLIIEDIESSHDQARGLALAITTTMADDQVWVGALAQPPTAGLDSAGNPVVYKVSIVDGTYALRDPENLEFDLDEVGVGDPVYFDTESFALRGIGNNLVFALIGQDENAIDAERTDGTSFVGSNRPGMSVDARETGESTVVPEVGVGVSEEGVVPRFYRVEVGDDEPTLVSITPDRETIAEAAIEEHSLLIPWDVGLGVDINTSAGTLIAYSGGFDFDGPVMLWDGSSANAFEVVTRSRLGSALVAASDQVVSGVYALAYRSGTAIRAELIRCRQNDIDAVFACASCADGSAELARNAIGGPVAISEMPQGGYAVAWADTISESPQISLILLDELLRPVAPAEGSSEYVYSLFPIGDRFVAEVAIAAAVLDEPEAEILVAVAASFANSEALEAPVREVELGGLYIHAD